MLICILDLFPVELIHILFDYLWAHEIFQSFFNISDYLDSILLNYDNYFVNFKSIRKKYFDLTCCHIQPHQVVSLTLSDGDDTPGQSQLFLSFFSIDQFIRLRVLTLIEIDEGSRSLFLNLDELKSLISLELELKYYLSSQKIPSHIKTLVLNDITSTYHNAKTFIFTNRFNHLRHLTLQNCSCSQLSDIFHFFPSLRTLKTSLTISRFFEIYNFPKAFPDSTSSSLTCLILSINTHVSRIDLERLLSHVPELRELELICSNGDRNLASAKQWETFIINRLPLLSTFNFMFVFPPSSLDEVIILHPFRSSFWINETRHWYIVYDRHQFRLFTVPRFAPHSIVHPHIPVQQTTTTVPIEQHSMFYDHITELTWNSDGDTRYQYKQVKTLTILCFDINTNVINLNQVQCLSVQIAQKWSFSQLIQIIKQLMPNVYCLKLDSAFNIESSEPVVTLVQIRTLYLSYFASLSGQNLIDLSPFFPSIERLTATVRTRRQLAFLIDRFVHLSSGSFYVLNSQIGVKKNLREPPVTRNWLVNNTHRLSKKIKNNFTCRFDHRHLFWLHLWISDNSDYQMRQSKISLNTIEKDEKETKHWWNSCWPRYSLK